MSQRKEVSDNEIMAAIRRSEKPYSTASRLAEKLPISRQAISYRLNTLEEQGKLCRDKISGSGVLYLIPEQIK